MEVIPIRTQPVDGPGSIPAFLDAYVHRIQEGDILAITSKIISILEGRIAAIDGKTDKRQLIRNEAEYYLEDPEYYQRYHIVLTVKGGQLIASSGIDESNGNGNFILWPEHPSRTAAQIWKHLRKKHRVTRLGIIITDSKTTPLRWGVTGTALAWCGIEPLLDYTGKPDIFGRPFRFEKTNVIDSLATASTLVMGEGAEQTPLALIRHAHMAVFTDHPPTEAERKSLRIAFRDDIYAPILTHAGWNKPIRRNKKNP